MTEADHVCGLCGAPNPDDAVVCVRCGALLAAYRSAPEPIAVAETPVASESPVEPATVDAPAAMIATPVTPGSATASIFGETKLAARQSVATSTVVKPPTTPPPMPPSSPVPRPTPEEVKARRLRRLADERVQALEDQAKQPPSTFQPTFQQLRRKTAPARRALLNLVARQPKEVGILSFVLFMVAMAMLGSGSLGAEVIGLFVLIAALVGGAAALLAVSRNVFDRHDPR